MTQLTKSDFYFNLPEELIAQTPVYPRDSSRLLHYDKKTGELKNKIFSPKSFTLGAIFRGPRFTVVFRFKNRIG